MPIRLNLLAEAQAAEEMRRRDPVKRAIIIGGCLVGLMLAWSASLQGKALIVKREVDKFERQMTAFTNDYHEVVQNQVKAKEIENRIAALNNLARARFLHAPVLNALQHATIDDVQMVRYRTEQTYVAAAPVKPRTNDNNRVIPGKPATVTERVGITLEGYDFSATPGDQVPKFKELVSNERSFKELLANNNFGLKQMSPPMPFPGSSSGKSCVLFTLESKTPDKTR